MQSYLYVGVKKVYFDTQKISAKNFATHCILLNRKDDCDLDIVVENCKILINTTKIPKTNGFSIKDTKKLQTIDFKRNPIDLIGCLNCR